MHAFSGQLSIPMLFHAEVVSFAILLSDFEMSSCASRADYNLPSCLLCTPTTLKFLMPT